MELTKRIDPEILPALEMMPSRTFTMDKLSVIRSMSEKLFEDMTLYKRAFLLNFMFIQA